MMMMRLSDFTFLFISLFKFRQNMSNYRFRKIHNGLLRIVKSEYFAKQIIFSNSPAHKH